MPRQYKVHLAALNPDAAESHVWLTACGISQLSVKGYIRASVDRPVLRYCEAPLVVDVDCKRCLNTTDAWSVKLWVGGIHRRRRYTGAFEAEMYLGRMSERVEVD